jgi:hypothetical protein
MARTYKAPRKFSINGKAGTVPTKKTFGHFEADVILHHYHAKKKLDRLRRKDRRWKLVQETVLNSRPLNGH